MNEPLPKMPSLALALSEAKDQIRGQIEEVKTANGKAQAVVGFTSIVAAVAGTHTTGMQTWLIGIPAIASAVLGLLAYESRDLKTGPALASILDNVTRPSEVLELDMVYMAIDHADHNTRTLGRKNAYLTAALACLVLEAGAVLLGRAFGIV